MGRQPRIAFTAGSRNRGLGTEATRLIVDYVFDEIDDPPVNRIDLEVYAFNPRATSVYERVGFHREGCFDRRCAGTASTSTRS